MNIRIMLDFDSATEAAAVLQRIGTGLPVIDPKDNPEHGAHVAAVRNNDGSTVAVPLPPAVAPAVAPQHQPAAPSSLATVGFGQGVTLPAGAIPAPASAAAAAQPTVPAAPSGTTAVPSVPTAPAQPGAPVAHAPLVPAAPPASAPGVELDKDGLPWDARIHAATKTKNKDNTWRQKRELDPAVRVAVEAELRAVLAANAAAAPVAQVPAAPVVPAAPTGVAPLAPAVEQAAAPTAPTAAVPQPSTPAPATPAANGASPSDAAPAPAGPLDFAGLFERLTPKMMTGEITTERVGAALQKVGLTAIGQLSLAPNLIPTVAAELGVA